MFVLPISGMAVELRTPDGADDVAIVEAPGNAVAQALAILARLARIVPRDSAPEARWPDLTVTDFEVALWALRVHLIGDRLRCAFDCPQPRCGERVETELRVQEMLADVEPRRPRGVIADAARPGWFRVGQGGTAFRLPTAGDQADVVGTAHAERRLHERCLEPPAPRSRELARVERAMEQLAPEVSRQLSGQCPACGEPLTASLHVPQFVVAELRFAAAGVYDEIHLIAGTYAWSEGSILALPRTRRQRYAERIRMQQRAL